MNESMKKFQELMKEAVQCVDNLKAETKNVEKEMIAERQKQLDMFLADLREFAEYVQPLKQYVRVRMSEDNNYSIYFAPNGNFGLYQGADYYRGWINGSEYKLFTSHKWVEMFCGLFDKDPTTVARRNLCTFLDAWDKDWFTTQLLYECEKILTQMAREANDAHEKAKADLANAMK